MNLLESLKDGRYLGRVAVGDVEFDLRFDLRGTVQISGDKLDVRNGGRVLKGSFHSDSFNWNSTLTAVSAALSYHGSGDLAKLTLTTASNGSIDARYSDNAMSPTPLVLSRVGDLFRDFTYTFDIEGGASFPPAPVALGNRPKISIEECFAKAGLLFQLSNGRKPVKIDADGAPWTLGQLEAMLERRSEAGDMNASNFYLLAGLRFVDSDVTGVMFDKPGRRGAAIFVDTLKSLYPDRFDAAIIRAAVHEFGHCLNLLHVNEAGTVNSQGTNSPSFMTYPQDYTGDGGVTQAERFDEYWKRFDFEFATDEVWVLRHGDTADRLPGFNPYHGSTFDRGIDRFARDANFRSTRQSGVEIELRLRPKRKGNLFEFGEPVHMEMEFKNTHDRALPIPTSLACHGPTRFLVTMPSGRQYVHSQPFSPCMDHNFKLLAKHRSEHRNICLSYTQDGIAFDSPGKYVVQALHEMPGLPTIASNKLRIWVRSPSRDIERHVIATFDPDPIRYLRVMGRPDIASAKNSLNHFCDQFRTADGGWIDSPHPLVYYFSLCEAWTSVHGFRLPKTAKKRNTVAMNWIVPRKPDLAYFRQALHMNCDYNCTILDRGHPFSNILFGKMSGLLSQSMATENDSSTDKKRKSLIRQIGRYLKAQNLTASNWNRLRRQQF